MIMFDTSLPQQSPDSWRRLNIAPTHHYLYARYPWGWEAQIHTDSEISRGGGPCDAPLVGDPTQSVVVIVLHHNDCGDFSGGEAVLVIRAAALVRHMSSPRSGKCVPWGDWKRDVMVVEIPHNVISYPYLRTFVLGTRILLVTGDWRGGGYRFQAYDFSRWACRALVRTGDGEKERMVMPNPEKIWVPRTPDIALENMRTLGDSLVMCAVGNSHNPLRCTMDLHIVREEYSFA